jgi:hypothetical protein
MISTANKIGIAGAVVLIAGLIVMLYPTSDTRVLGVGVYIQLSAFVAIVFAALRGSLKWFFMLLLIPCCAYLWLLAQGH